MVLNVAFWTVHCVMVEYSSIACLRTLNKLQLGIFGLNHIMYTTYNYKVIEIYNMYFYSKNLVNDVTCCVRLIQYQLYTDACQALHDGGINRLFLISRTFTILLLCRRIFLACKTLITMTSFLVILWQVLLLIWWNSALILILKNGMYDNFYIMRGECQ